MSEDMTYVTTVTVGTKSQGALERRVSAEVSDQRDTKVRANNYSTSSLAITNFQGELKT